MLSRSEKDIASKFLAPSSHVNGGTFEGGFHGASSGERNILNKMGGVVVPSEQRVTKRKAAQARPATLMDVFKKTVRYGSRTRRHPSPLVRHEEAKLEGALAMDFSPEPTIEDMALMLPGRGVITPKRRIKRTRKGDPVPRPATLLMVPVPPSDSDLGVRVPPYPVRVVSSWKPVKKVVDLDTRARKTIISPSAVVEEISIIDDAIATPNNPRARIHAADTSNVEEKGLSCVQQSHPRPEGGEDPSVETVIASPVTALDTEKYSFFDASITDDESILWPNIHPNSKSRWSIATEDMLVEEIQQPKFTEHGSISAMHREILNSFVTARAIFIEMKIGKLHWGIEASGVSSVEVDNATGPESVGSQADRFKDAPLRDTASTTTPEDAFFPADSEPTTSVESFVSPSFLSLCSRYTTEDEDQPLVDNTLQESFPGPDSSFGPIYDDPPSPSTKYAGESLTKIDLKKTRHTTLFTGDFGLSHLSPSKEDLELEVEPAVGGFGFPLLPPPPIPSVCARAPESRPMLFRTRINLRETGPSNLVNARKSLNSYVRY